MRAIVGLAVIVTVLFILAGLGISFDSKPRAAPEEEEQIEAACDSEFWRCVYSEDGVACDRLKDHYPGGKIAPVCKRARQCWKWWEANCR